MENLDTFSNQNPEKPKSFGPNWYKDIEILDEKTGAFKIKEASGEERIVNPSLPPVLHEMEEAERQEAGVAQLINQLPQAVRMEIKEKARMAAANELQKKQHLLEPAQVGKELLALSRQKEWELAIEWLENNSETGQKPVA